MGLDEDHARSFGDDVATFSLTKFDPTPSPEVSFTLTAVGGPHAGHRWVVDGSGPSRTLLGTGPTCEIRLTDRHASRRHVALEIVGARLHVEDLGSTNGTFTGSIQVKEVWLSGGEQLRVGETVLRVESGPRAAETPLTTDSTFGNVLGASREMRRLYPLLAKLAASDVPVVIEGETGTGKEALAEAIHAEGPRRDRPFVVFDCTSVPPSLVESELFGHERGAFTGAVTQRRGVFEQAHGGTLLIDEIGDLDLALQPKLLRAIERSEVRRVGGDRWLQVDVRVLSATRRDLEREVAAGRFRDDLFHRLAVTRVELPPLRSRRGDVPLLVEHFAARLGGAPDAIPAHVLEAWEEQPWPGNIRELRNAVARYLAVGELAQLRGTDFGVEVGNSASSRPQPSVPPRPSAPPPGVAGEDWLAPILAEGLTLADARERVLQVFERRYIETTLAVSGGNVGKAAAAAGVALRYFQLLRAKRTRGKSR